MINKFSQEENCKFLIKNHASEICICHHLAYYLYENLGGKWDVDIEYNLVSESSYSKYKCINENGRSFIRPDIIVHRRDRIDIDDNLLWCQAKRRNNPKGVEDDVGFMKHLTKRGCEVICKEKGNVPNYQYGLFLVFDNRKDSSQLIHQLWFENGKPISIDDFYESVDLRSMKKAVEEALSGFS